jgi:hypothetical protein
MTAKPTARHPESPLRSAVIPEMSKAAQLREWMIGAGLVLLTVLAYLPSFRAGFLWDDDTMLTANRAILSPQGLKQIWASTLLPDYFPLTSTSLWIEWRLWSFHAGGYHATNVLLHAASVLIFWRVLKKLEVPGAWIASILFALHPVNVETVAWIAERKNLLAMIFFLLTVWSWVRAEEIRGSSAAPRFIFSRYFGISSPC